MSPQTNFRTNIHAQNTHARAGTYTHIHTQGGQGFAGGAGVQINIEPGPAAGRDGGGYLPRRGPAALGRHPGRMMIHGTILVVATTPKLSSHTYTYARTQVMLAALREFGVQYSWEDNDRILVLEGCGGRIKPPAKDIMLNNAGTVRE